MVESRGRTHMSPSFRLLCVFSKPKLSRGTLLNAGVFWVMWRIENQFRDDFGQ